jgi:hypothetical protein
VRESLSARAAIVINTDFKGYSATTFFGLTILAGGEGRGGGPGSKPAVWSGEGDNWKGATEGVGIFCAVMEASKGLLCSRLEQRCLAASYS